MLVKLISAAPVGLESVPVMVEVDVASRGLFKYVIVGLASKAVDEAKERVITALSHLGASLPEHKVLVNLAPADLPKEGPVFDLAMAVGILSASGQLPPPTRALFLGELALDGSLRPVRGVLSALLMAKRLGIRTAFIPWSNRHEAAWVKEVKTYPLKDLTDYVHHVQNLAKLKPVLYRLTGQPTKTHKIEVDLADIHGQQLAKKALIVAAAGGRNLFMEGQPGSGKTLLAKALTHLLPPLTPPEALILTQIYSVAGRLRSGVRPVHQRPFRAPHHSISLMGMIGGGTNPKPGEVSLAHLGVLFIDEAPEMPRSVLEALRQPLEDKQVTITRTKQSVTYPANFTLVMAANPCPCGWYGSETKPCRCTPYQVHKYRHKLSGPMLDRMDLYVKVGAVKLSQLKQSVAQNGPDTKTARQMIIKARRRQAKRYRSQLVTNASLGLKQIKQLNMITPQALSYLYQALDRLKLSTRAFYKLQKVALTIADLEESDQVRVKHVMEALQYRRRDQI